MSWTLLTLLSVVQAAPVAPPGSNAMDREGIRLSVRGVGESWQDPNLTRIYKDSVFSGGVGVAVPLHTYIGIEIEASYKRQAGVEVFAEDGEVSGIASAFELVPLTLAVHGRWPLANSGELYLGLGPTISVFTEEHSIRSDNGQVSTQGMKINMDSRIGVRIDTGLHQPPMAPGLNGELQAIDLEVFIGRRWQFGTVGFDLSAWRAGLGLAFRM